MELEFKLEAFEGPLDLLLHLIEKNKIDIFDIPIREITDQYLQAVGEITENSMGDASDFLLMAATLAEIKSRMLLPSREEEEEDPRSELVNRLLEYKLTKNLAGELSSMKEESETRYFRKEPLPAELTPKEEPADPALLLQDVSLDQLKGMLQSLLRQQKIRQNPVRDRFRSIKREKIQVIDQINRIREEGRKKPHFSFRSLFSDKTDRETVVVTFLAALEMMRVGELAACQDEPFGDIAFSYQEKEEETFTESDLAVYEEQVAP